MTSSSNEQDSLNYVKRQNFKFTSQSTKNKSFNPTSPPKSKKCFRCNGNHSAMSCKHKDSKCFSCSKFEHLSSVCRKRSNGKQMRHQTHVLENENSEIVQNEHELFD